jgi:hypothetical protein
MFLKKKHVAPKATYREVWSKGDAATKLSFFIMGSQRLIQQAMGKRSRISDFRNRIHCLVRILAVFQL